MLSSLLSSSEPDDNSEKKEHSSLGSAFSACIFTLLRNEGIFGLGESGEEFEF